MRKSLPKVLVGDDDDAALDALQGAPLPLRRRLRAGWRAGTAGRDQPPDRAAVILPFLLCALNPLPAQITRERRLLAVEPYRPW